MLTCVATVVAAAPCRPRPSQATATRLLMMLTATASATAKAGVRLSCKAGPTAQQDTDQHSTAQHTGQDRHALFKELVNVIWLWGSSSIQLCIHAAQQLKHCTAMHITAGAQQHVFPSRQWQLQLPE